MNRLVMDPEELIPGRVELPLNSLGLEVGQEGADWGESQVELQLARQIVGESVTNRHLTNVEMTVPLIVAEHGVTSLATAAYKLQQKVGLWQAEGGWLRRDFSIDGKFNGSVAYEIKSANLSGLQGWLMEHKQIANSVALKLIRHPLCFATVEEESETFSASEARELEWHLSEILGTAPGLIRLVVKNENAEGDWRGLIAPIESRDYPGASTASTTAALSYEAENLTPKGEAKVVEGVAGSSGNKCVEHANLTAGWLAILDSKITASGHMTHKGVRRVWARIEDPGSEAGNVELRLRWRALGSPRWDESNSIVPTPLVGNWCHVDLGEARPELAVVGNERWEWQILARAKNGSGKIRIDKVYPEPVEQFVTLSSPEASSGADAQSAKSPATAENDASAGGVAWTNPGNAKASDNSYATLTASEIGATTSQYLLTKKYLFEIPEAATITGIIASIERKASEADSSYVHDEAVRIVKGGVRSTLENKALAAGWPTSDATQTYGSSSDLWGETWTPADINAEGFGVAFRATVYSPKGKAVTGSVDHISITVYYTEAANENKVCFATRSIELRTEGCYRQAPTEEVWGRVVPSSGFYLSAPPALLENRTARGLLIPSRGAFGEEADSSTNKLSVVVKYRPAYHFAREAAE